MHLPCIMRFFFRYFSESSFCPRYFPVASNKAFSISSILKFRFWIKSLIVMSNLLFSSKAACVYLDVYKSRDFSFEAFKSFFDWGGSTNPQNGEVKALSVSVPWLDVFRLLQIPFQNRSFLLMSIRLYVLPFVCPFLKSYCSRIFFLPGELLQSRSWLPCSVRGVLLLHQYRADSWFR